MPKRFSICLRLHGLAVCDWAHMPTVFVMIKISCLTVCLKYNKALQPYLKYNDNVTQKKRDNFTRTGYSNELT